MLNSQKAEKGIYVQKTPKKQLLLNIPPPTSCQHQKQSLDQHTEALQQKQELRLCFLVIFFMWDQAELCVKGIVLRSTFANRSIFPHIVCCRRINNQ